MPQSQSWSGESVQDLIGGSDGVSLVSEHDASTASTMPLSTAPAARASTARSRGPATFLLIDPLNSPLESIQEADPNVEMLRQLPVLVSFRDPNTFARHRSTTGLLGISYPPVDMIGLLLALDDLLAMQAEGNAPGAVHDTERVIGGLTTDDPRGYPFLDPKDPSKGITPQIGKVAATRPALVVAANLSLGPSHPKHPFDLRDPVNFATYFAAQRLLIVMAAGNESQRADNVETMSAWAEASWVLAVGATSDEEGTELARYSSVGAPGIPDSGPDVVAWGAASLDRSVVGTSFAAPKVTNIASIFAAAILQLRQAVDALNGAATGVPVVGVGIIDTNFTPFPRPDGFALPALPILGVQQSSLKATVDLLAQWNVSHDVSCTPSRLRAMITTSARPVPNNGPHQVGHGFVSTATTEAYLRGFTGAHFGWLFGATKLSTEQLNALAPYALFDSDAVPILIELVRRSTPIWLYDHVRWQMGLKWGLDPAPPAK